MIKGIYIEVYATLLVGLSMMTTVVVALI